MPMDQVLHGASRDGCGLLFFSVCLLKVAP